MANKIDSVSKRTKLAQQHEPYWQKITTGRYLGFRRTNTGGDWKARYYDSLTGKKHHDTLEMPYLWDDKAAYDAAHEKATEWFAQISGAEDVHYSVNSAINDYADHLKIHNSEDTSREIKQRLDKHLKPVLGTVELAKLKTAQIKKWHAGLVKLADDPESVRASKDNANRILSIAKAAFNLAFTSGAVATDSAWRRVKPFKGVAENRKLFLTDKQVTSMIDKAEGAFKALLMAAKLTGARYGELTGIFVEDFDPKEGRIHMSGKTGKRYCYLSDEALNWFTKQAKVKTPKAWLLPRDDGSQWGKSHQHRPMKEAVKKAKLPRDTVFYSLRHYHISKALLAGLPMQVVAENCGTSVRMIESHYGKFLPKDRREMLNQVALG